MIVPGLKVDASNYITEIFILRQAKARKANVPPIPFWQKQYSEGYEKLTESYVYELTQVKKMLKVFCPEVLVRYFQGSKWPSLRYLTKENLAIVVTDLFKAQIKYIGTIEEIKKSDLERQVNKVEYIEIVRAKANNAIGKGL